MASENQKENKKFVPKKLEELKLYNQADIFVYIEELHVLLKKNEKKLKKYKDKAKTLLKKLNETETTPKPEEAKIAVPSTVIKDEIKEEHSSSATDVVDFVNDIRQAAEQAQNLNGFVYEPTSGLYYDQKTGYYYNAEYGLYYDGNSGCYYNYNQEKNEFEFHSQVEVQPNQAKSKCSNDDEDCLENYASDDDDDDVGADEVEFDEFGVITDQQKLQKIKHDKVKLKQALKERFKRKKKLCTEVTTDKEKSKSKNKHKRARPNHSKSDDSSESNSVTSNMRRKRIHEFEDGEISTSSSSSTGSNDSETESALPIFKSGSCFQDIAKKYPPSLRIIVQETNLENLKVGSLNLITFKGGSLGREGKHDVIIPDLNVSKFHLKFSYDTKNAIYQLIDLGSRNGTLLNGTRLSGSKTESTAYDVVHGSVIQISSTKLLCHVHEGNTTCGLCEPGLLIEPTRENATPIATIPLTHKEQLKKLQKKYGLENEKFVDAGKQSVSGYNDRAASRRVQVGSSTDKEKTQTACVNTAISSENKGFKMLSKLGWSKGEALGKTSVSSGLLEPINVITNDGKKGLGCEGQPNKIIADIKKVQTWKKTQERYQKADIFCIDSDESD